MPGAHDHTCRNLRTATSSLSGRQTTFRVCRLSPRCLLGLKGSTSPTEAAAAAARWAAALRPLLLEASWLLKVPRLPMPNEELSNPPTDMERRS